MQCRRCKLVEGTIFLDARNKPTKTPLCRECYEEAIRHDETKGGYRPGYVGPGRDHFHQNADSSMYDALDWYERQYMDEEEDD